MNYELDEKLPERTLAVREGARLLWVGFTTMPIGRVPMGYIANGGERSGLLPIESLIGHSPYGWRFDAAVEEEIAREIASPEDAAR